jgi:cysteine desulfurase
MLGVARGLLAKKKIARPGHIITTQIEHRAVLEACGQLESEGWAVTYVPVDKDGLVNSDELKKALRSDTVLVSVMYANNEIGTIEPIKEIAKILRQWRKRISSPPNLEPVLDLIGEGVVADRGGIVQMQINSNRTTPALQPPLLSQEGINTERLPYFHIDACQAPRFLPLGVEQLGVDLMTINGSKMYGPKGTGALFVKRNTFIEPIVYGGGQERGLRSGTENVAGLVGLAKALEIARAECEKESVKLTKLRDHFIAGLQRLPGVTINGSLSARLPNNVNATFAGQFGELLVLRLDAKGIACSTGSACSAHHKDDAHVIISLGKTMAEADNTVRFTLGRDTTLRDVKYTIAVVKEILEQEKKIII